MALATDSTPLERLLADPAAEVTARARTTRSPTLVRLEVPLPHADPWDWIEGLDTPGGTTIAWDEPAAGRSFVAARPVACHVLDGADRLADAADFCSRAAEHIVGATSSSAPLVLAGLAFGPRRDRPAGAPWAGWGDGALWIPGLLIDRTDRGTVATITARVIPGESPHRVTARLRELAALAVGRIGGRPAAATERPHFSSADPAGWHAAVHEALNSFGAGRLDKVVLARALEAHVPEDGSEALTFDPWATARSLRERHRGCTTWAIRRPDGSAFVGATPELLVRREGLRVTTGALAGTAPRGADAREDGSLARQLLDRAKERHEHAVVVDAIRTGLATVADDVTVAAAPVIRRLPDMQHLETPIGATLRPGHDLWDLVAALHPTPAVGGQPPEAALAWLADHEALDRGWYAAPIGWLDAAGDGAFHVALRSALLRGGRAWAYAGAGLVAGSNADAEWAETEHKLEAVRAALVARPVNSGSTVGRAAHDASEGSVR